ncbi:hypothetical protein MAPG_01449 [Magnaporthiopsis poae ATCC 64411]|uniref:Uncharacterized protein n=1 Tax=Magnaporthiopsis poae (strain ATCC 64411 / 73-15) TaxID=644358 RepID=A0A0C4DNQ5_MAGP6|nr:hypothetical protein MAPG_01449 [Magnaporthiopsis poae ATCC 64411]
MGIILATFFSPLVGSPSHKDHEDRSVSGRGAEQLYRQLARRNIRKPDGKYNGKGRHYSRLARVLPIRAMVIVGTVGMIEPVMASEYCRNGSSPWRRSPMARQASPPGRLRDRAVEYGHRVEAVLLEQAALRGPLGLEMERVAWPVRLSPFTHKLAGSDGRA